MKTICCICAPDCPSQLFSSYILPWSFGILLYLGNPFVLWLRWGCVARKEFLLPSEAVHGSTCLVGRWRESRTKESFRSDSFLFHFLLTSLLKLYFELISFLNFIWNWYWKCGHPQALLIWVRTQIFLPKSWSNGSFYYWSFLFGLFSIQVKCSKCMLASNE